MSTEEKLTPAAWRRPSIIDRAQWSYSTHEPAAWSEREALYDEATVRRLSAEVQELREALNIGVMAFTDIAQFRPSGPLDNFQQIASHARATTLEALPPMRAALKPETGE
jgi:hypothetical protein